jgi:hypothetical protein
MWNNGIYHTSNANATDASTVTFGHPVTTGTVARLKLLSSAGNTYLYAAMAEAGISRMKVPGGSLVSLNNANGGTVDTQNSIWVTLDGYVNGSGDHVIVAGCSGGVIGKQPNGQNNPNHTNVVSLTLPGGSTPASYKDLTGTANINTATLPPFDADWWHAGANWQFWLGGSDSANPNLLIDPNTIDNQSGPTFYLCNSGGFFRSRDGGQNWRLAVTGMPVIGMHCFAIDPRDGAHFVHCGDDYTSIDVSLDPSGNTPANVVGTSPGANLSGGHRESHAVAIDPTDSRVYVGLNYSYGKTNGGAVMWRVQAAQTNNQLNPWTDTGYAAALSPPPSSPDDAPAVIGLIAGTANSKRWAVAIAQGQGPYYWDGNTGWTPSTEADSSPLPGSGNTVGQMIPMVAGHAAGYLYCFDRANGVYRSINYGRSWTQIWNRTTQDKRTGWLAFNPDPNVSGELWIGTDSGLYKMTGAGSGVVGQPGGGGPQVSPVGAPFGAGAAGVAFAPSGAVFAIALPGPAPTAPPVTTLYYSTDGGSNWADWTGGDGSVGSYGAPAGQLGISSDGWLWAASGEHFGYYDHLTG